MALYNFTYSCNGKRYTVKAPDSDRARIVAKRLAGPDWSPKAKLVGITWGGVA